MSVSSAGPRAAWQGGAEAALPAFHLEPAGPLPGLRAQPGVMVGSCPSDAARDRLSATGPGERFRGTWGTGAWHGRPAAQQRAQCPAGAVRPWWAWLDCRRRVARSPRSLRVAVAPDPASCSLTGHAVKTGGPCWSGCAAGKRPVRPVGASMGARGPSRPPCSRERRPGVAWLPSGGAGAARGPVLPGVPAGALPLTAFRRRSFGAASLGEGGPWGLGRGGAVGTRLDRRGLQMPLLTAVTTAVAGSVLTRLLPLIESWLQPEGLPGPEGRMAGDSLHRSSLRVPTVTPLRTPPLPPRSLGLGAPFLGTADRGRESDPRGGTVRSLEHASLTEPPSLKSQQ